MGHDFSMGYIRWIILTFVLVGGPQDILPRVLLPLFLISFMKSFNTNRVMNMLNP